MQLNVVDKPSSFQDFQAGIDHVREVLGADRKARRMPKQIFDRSILRTSLFDEEARVAQRLVRELEQDLAKMGPKSIEDRVGYLPNGDRHIESLLSVCVQVDEILALRTSLRLMCNIVNDESTPKLFYFLRISGYDDILRKENHGQGYHFHYCDKRERRSDTILTFDDPTPSLFFEKHAENKAKFIAKPMSWSSGRRFSVYGACLPIWRKMGPAHFKRPGNKASVLYP